MFHSVQINIYFFISCLNLGFAFIVGCLIKFWHETHQCTFFVSTLTNHYFRLRYIRRSEQEGEICIRIFLLGKCNKEIVFFDFWSLNIMTRRVDVSDFWGTLNVNCYFPGISFMAIWRKNGMLILGFDFGTIAGDYWCWYLESPEFIHDNF